MTEILEMFLKDLLYVVVIAVVPVLGKYLVSLASRGIEYLKSKKTALDTEGTLKAKDDMLDTIMEVIQTAVDMTTQTFVDDMKKNGTWDSEAIKVAFDKSMTSIKAQLSDAESTFIVDTYNNLDTFLTQRIEAYINVRHS